MVPWLAGAAVLVWLQPLAVAVAAVLVAHAWAIPLLYAQRGANVLRPLPAGEPGAQARSVGLLGDLVSHEARERHARTGLVIERGELGTWVVGPAGAVLVRGGRGRLRRVDCWCVRVAEPNLPSGDRIAHLLLALRSDETGFATVSNLAFSGAAWRVRRRLRREARPALDAAAAT